MRKKDETKRMDEKAIKTINFEVPVLRALEIKSRENHTTVSKLVNLACRRMVMDEALFLDSMALFHEQERAKFEFLKQNLVQNMLIRKTR
jgi:hypothetical protein